MMRGSSKVQAAGIAFGLGLFVAVGLFVSLGANSGRELKPSEPLSAEVTGPAEKLSQSFAAIAAHVAPAVVSVYSEKTVRFRHPDMGSPFGDDFFRQFFGGQLPPGPQREYSMPQQSEGTGMILDKQGHILTNYHVVAGEDSIKVQLVNKQSFEAKILGADPKTDVAVLELRGSVPSNLPTVTLGDSDALQVGSLVMAIGSPFGLTQTVTSGIVSAKGRSNVGIADYEDFLQTDAPINPGNSGGPLINMRGEVVGMNSAIETQVGQFGGVGFAIPSNMIKAMLPSLLKGEHIQRGVLGVVIQKVTPELAEEFHAPPRGALVAEVRKGSPAEKAGIMPGDVIVSYDGTTIENTGQLRNLVATTAPGARVQIGVVRKGASKTLTVTIGKLSAASFAEAGPGGGVGEVGKLGLSVETLNAELARRYGIEARRGVVITGVAPGSPGANYGLQPGDLVVEADQQPVSTVAQLQKILNAQKDQVLLLINRKGTSVFLVLKFR